MNLAGSMRWIPRDHRCEEACFRSWLGTVDPLPQAGGQPAGGTEGLDQARGERVGRSGQVSEAAVQGRLDGSALREARLNRHGSSAPRWCRGRSRIRRARWCYGRSGKPGPHGAACCSLRRRRDCARRRPGSPRSARRGRGSLRAVARESAASRNSPAPALRWGWRRRRRNPTRRRLNRSVTGASYSYRKPMLSVSFRVSFRSSCQYRPKYQSWSAELALMSMEPPGMPSSSEANSCPIGAAEELSSGPRV